MTYTFVNFRDQVADPIMFPNIATQSTIANILNRAARIVTGEIDLRTTRRYSYLTPKLFDDQYEYTAPTDLKDEAVIDIVPQVNRILNSRMVLVTPEYFDRKKSINQNMIAVFDDDGARKLKIDIDVDEDSETISELSSTTDPSGTWSAYNDATNLVVDTDNYITGGGCLKFDLTGAATTAGIVNSTLTAFDISDYVDDGSIFNWAYINSITNLTNFIIRIGEDASNYYQMTATTQNDGNAFVNGWNLLRFDFNGKSTTGTPVDTSINYVALYMTKTAGKADDGYRFDNLVIHTGAYYSIYYYSKYAWQNSGGTWIENSSALTDYLNADTDEFELFVMKGKKELARELRDYDQMKLADAEYEKLKLQYQLKNKSQRILQTEYYY